MDRLWNPPCVAAVLSGLTQDKQLLYGSSAGLSGSLEGSPAAPQAHISLGRYFKGNEFSEKDWGGGWRRVFSSNSPRDLHWHLELAHAHSPPRRVSLTTQAHPDPRDLG